MKIALAQINPIVGDIRGNLAKIRAEIKLAQRKKVDLVVFPELCITGYPPRDLVELADFVEKNKAAVQELAREITRPAVILGFVDTDLKGQKKVLYNAAAVLSNRKVIAVRHKTLLPNYDVFDERRHFTPTVSNDPVLLMGRWR